MSDELQDFLRQVLAAKGQKPPQSRPTAQKPPPRSQQWVEAEVIGEDDVEVIQTLASKRTSLRHTTDLSTSDVSEHAENLGGAAQESKKALDSHMKSVFDHKVGRLARKDSEVASPEATTVGLAEGLMAMLRTPDGVRQAVLLNEILQRPEHRW